jgi:hypothetical protein
MPIPSTIESLSTTVASNGPSGSDQRNTADDGLRTAYAFIRMLVTQGSDVASASSITPASTGAVFDITGTTAITALSSTNSWDGRRVLLQFDGILTLTHSSNLALPGSANITTAAGDVAEFVQRGSGAWRCIYYTRADGSFINTTLDYEPSWAPTPTEDLNLDAVTVVSGHWIRVGTVVFFSLTGTANPTSGAVTLVQFRVPPPIASSFSNSAQCSGTLTFTNGGASVTYEAGTVSADTTEDAISFSFTTNITSSSGWTATGSYVIV